MRQQAAPPAPKQKLIVKPKRIFKKKQELPPAIEDASTQESEESDDETDEEVEQVQTFKRPQPKPKINKIVEMESKLKEIEQSLNKPVQKISKYDSMMSKFFSKL
jgi:hypothetical protein